MKSKRGIAILMASAVVAGYSGAAVFSAWGLPAVPIATGFGESDGLTWSRRLAAGDLPRQTACVSPVVGTNGGGWSSWFRSTVSGPACAGEPAEFPVIAVCTSRPPPTSGFRSC